MNTPFKISDDQNTITHESGLVTVFVEDKEKSNGCNGCFYYENINYECQCYDAPCCNNKRVGIFVKKKTPTYNELIAKREELMKQLIEVDNQLKDIGRSIPTKTTVFGNYKLDKNL